MSQSALPPPQVIASWPTPNYIDPTTQGPAYNVISLCFGILAILFFSARLYSRFFVTRAPGLDDLFCGVGLGLAIANGILVAIAVKDYGVGRHVWDVPIQWLPSLRKNQYVSIWLNFLALGFIKISILLFYRRLSISFPRAFLWATYVGFFYNGGFIVAFMIVLGLLCRPLNAYWLRFSLEWIATDHPSTCINEGLLFSVAGTLSCIGDFYTTTVPLLLIIYLPLPRHQKLALYALFAVGYLIVIFGIIRTVYLFRLFHVANYDMAWLLWDYWVWNMLELFLAIIAASASANKPLLSKIFVYPLHRFLSSGFSGTTYLGSSRSKSRTGGSSKRRSGNVDLENGAFAEEEEEAYEINEYGRIVPVARTSEPSTQPDRNTKKKKHRKVSVDALSSSRARSDDFSFHYHNNDDDNDNDNTNLNKNLADKSHPKVRVESYSKPSSPITPVFITNHSSSKHKHKKTASSNRILDSRSSTAALRDSSAEIATTSDPISTNNNITSTAAPKSINTPLSTRSQKGSRTQTPRPWDRDWPLGNATAISPGSAWRDGYTGGGAGSERAEVRKDEDEDKDEDDGVVFDEQGFPVYPLGDARNLPALGGRSWPLPDK
ncbi:MAG: hypothetical protein Q9227_000609 [Pyrenula ochraceoflavens]